MANNEVLVKGVNPERPVDAILVNAPLKNYDLEPRLNNFTLPVLGLGYIATYAKCKGHNIGVLDAESLAMGPSKIAKIVNAIAPRWVGFNLLAPTYDLAATTASLIDPSIEVVLGGHQAKAMPARIVADGRWPRIDAMILGEAELIFESILGDKSSREWLPGVLYRDPLTGSAVMSRLKSGEDPRVWTAPDINSLPFVDRTFFVQDPFTAEDGRTEASFVGSRGCPYECSFCGAARSANPDILIRTRDPDGIVDEMEWCNHLYGVNSVRFVDDLFLASLGFMRSALPRFIDRGVAQTFVWDATGRINTLSKADDEMLRIMVKSGCREVALGIESGSQRVLDYVDKHLSPEMILHTVAQLTGVGINVKGYVILGFPGESASEMHATVELIHKLWAIADANRGEFRCSAFEFRPYPGTKEWHRLMATGRYAEDELLNYAHVDLADHGTNPKLFDRDEFNFSVGLQFSDVPLPEVRRMLAELALAQKARSSHQ